VAILVGSCPLLLALFIALGVILRGCARESRSLDGKFWTNLFNIVRAPRKERERAGGKVPPASRVGVAQSPVGMKRQRPISGRRDDRLGTNQPLTTLCKNRSYSTLTLSTVLIVRSVKQCGNEARCSSQPDYPAFFDRLLSPVRNTHTKAKQDATAWIW
jgi:hypothetical protein